MISHLDYFQERVDHVLIEDSLLDSMHESPAKRTRTSGHDHPKLSIAKQYSPFGFHCTLEAPTAQWVRRDEDRCTYMNKGQFYGVTLEYRANPAEPITESLVNVRSVVMLVFRDAKEIHFNYLSPSVIDLSRISILEKKSATHLIDLV